MRKVASSFYLFGATNTALAAGGGDIPVFPNLYQFVSDVLGLPYYMASVIGALFITALLAVVGLRYRNYANLVLAGQVVPTGKFSLSEFVEWTIEFVYNLCKDLLGSNAKSHMPLISTLFFFIWLTNVSGLFPFLPPSSTDLSANLAMGLMVFVVYNFVGVKEHGFGPYIAHFAGPKIKIPIIGLLLPLLIFFIEMISHGFRPVSLSLRLMGNIFGDHMLVAVFTGMVYFLVPSILMFFGLLVSTVQAFVFTLLSTIYISMAGSHDH